MSAREGSQEPERTTDGCGIEFYSCPLLEKGQTCGQFFVCFIRSERSSASTLSSLDPRFGITRTLNKLSELEEAVFIPSAAHVACHQNGLGCEGVFRSQ